jgi:hypothetical protein
LEIHSGKVTSKHTYTNGMKGFLVPNYSLIFITTLHY